MILIIFGFAVFFVATTSALPSLLILTIAERYKIRNVWAYIGSGACAAVAAVVVAGAVFSNEFGLTKDVTQTFIFAVAGASGGFAYWYVAIKLSGVRNESLGRAVGVF